MSVDINIKEEYIKALKKVSILSPNYKTAKAILGLLTYYSTGNINSQNINIDALEGNSRADRLFDVLTMFTNYVKVEDENACLGEGYYKFSKFDIPKEIRETIKRKYTEQLQTASQNSKDIKQQARIGKQKLIQDINDNLNNTL